MIVEWDMELTKTVEAKNVFTVLAHPTKPVDWAIGKSIVLGFAYDKDTQNYVCTIPAVAMDDFYETYFTLDPVQLELF